MPHVTVQYLVRKTGTRPSGLLYITQDKIGKLIMAQTNNLKYYNIYNGGFISLDSVDNSSDLLQAQFSIYIAKSTLATRSEAVLYKTATIASS